MEREALVNKIGFMFNLANEHIYTEEQYNKLLSYTKEHNDDVETYGFFGYSVSDYAIATLKWLGTDRAKLDYEIQVSSLSEFRKNEIDTLVKKQLYKQM